MISLTWDNFDKAFWVSSTNMRNLINGAINININLGNVEDNVNNIGQEVGDIRDDLITTDGDLADVLELLQRHIENQQQINSNFMAVLQDITDILVDHEERISALE